jgi:hypothetical protein
VYLPVARWLAAFWLVTVTNPATAAMPISTAQTQNVARS